MSVFPLDWQKVTTIWTYAVVSIRDIQEWISHFKASRAVVKFGDPLWAYKVTDDELQQLQSLLKALAEENSIRKVIRLYERQYSIAFVLFASTWLQRNSVGRSKWGPVLSAIGADVLDQADRSSLVENGLRAWGLSVFSTDTSSRYLDTMACQGGLPRKDLLRESHSQIMSYFERVLAYYERYQHSVSLTETAVTALEDLPITLQQEAFAELVTRLIECLLDWKATYDLGGVRDAVRVLDIHHPRWREDLPFLVHDEEAETLIDSLLKRASSIIRRELHPVRVKRTMIDTGSGYRLKAELYIARQIDDNDLTRQFAYDGLPRFFQLNTNTSDNQRFRTAVFTHRQGVHGGWQVSTYTTGLRNAIATGRIGYELLSDGRVISEGTYYRGEALDHESPWIFEVSGGSLNYLGQGSVKSNKSKLFVVSATEPKPGAPFSSIQSLGDVIGFSRTVFEVSGEVQIEGLSGYYSIKCNAGSNEEFLVEVRGAKFEGATADVPIYLGLPQVTYTGSDSSGQVIEPQDLRWFANSSSSLRPLDDPRAIGRGAVVWECDGSVIWEHPCILLPSDFAVEWQRPSAEIYQLHLKHTEKLTLGMQTGYEGWLQGTPSSLEGRTICTLVPKDPVVEDVRIALIWNNNPQTETLLTLPIQFDSAVLTDRDGVPYREFESGTLAPQDLPGMQVLVRSSHPIDKVCVTASLFAPQRWEYETFLVSKRACFATTASKGTYVLKGSGIADLVHFVYRQADQLDSYVRLKFEAIAEDPEKYYKVLHSHIPDIKRYKHDPGIVWDKGAFELPATPLLRNVDDPTLYLSPIWDLNAPPVPLKPESTETAVWRYPLPTDGALDYGHWLVWGDQSKSVHPRIKAYDVPIARRRSDQMSAMGQQLLEALKGDAEERETPYEERLEPSSLEYAVKYLDPNDEDDKRRVKRIIQNMGRDLDHQGWSYIEGIIARIDAIEPLAFFAMTALMRNPFTLVACLFHKRGNFHRVWELSEKMGFEWVSIRPHVWINTIEKCHEWIQGRLEPLKAVSEEYYHSECLAPFEPLHEKGPLFEFFSKFGTGQPTFEPVDIWATEEQKCEGLDDQTLGKLFFAMREMMKDRHKGKLFNNMGSFKTSLSFIESICESWDDDELPPPLKGFLGTIKIHNDPHHRKWVANMLTIGIPLKMAFFQGGFFSGRLKNHQQLKLRHLIALLDEWDREWLQTVLLIGHHACELTKLEYKPVGYSIDENKELAS